VPGRLVLGRAVVQWPRSSAMDVTLDVQTCKPPLKKCLWKFRTECPGRGWGNIGGSLLVSAEEALAINEKADRLHRDIAAFRLNLAMLFKVARSAHKDD
jgi:hypothetical protein